MWLRPCHRASDCTTRVRPHRVSRNKHFSHSPVSSTAKQSCMKHSNSYLRDRDVKHLQGSPLSRTKRIRERRKIDVCVTMKKSARRMASTTSDTGDTSSSSKHKAVCVCACVRVRACSSVWVFVAEVRFWFSCSTIGLFSLHVFLSLSTKQDAYAEQRATAVSQIESTIVELGQIFNQLATMIKEQEEQVMRSVCDDSPQSTVRGERTRAL